MSLHGKNRLGKKDRKRWRYDKILVHLKEFAPKEGKLLNPKKIQAIMNMHVLHNSQYIQVFNGMAQIYKCFIKNFAMIMAPIMKLTR